MRCNAAAEPSQADPFVDPTSDQSVEEECYSGIRNYTAARIGQVVFVKQYLPDAALAGKLAIIDLSRIAVGAGVPNPWAHPATRQWPRCVP
jgi:hypothetical protein